jgi:hypothetical protein
MATDKADRRAAAGELLGLRPEDMKFGTGFAAYSQFARSGAGRLIYRGIWLGIGALTVAVFVAALLN